MWRFVPLVLLGASRYLQSQTVFEDTRLLQLVVLMLQNVQWAIDVDP